SGGDKLCFGAVNLGHKRVKIRTHAKLPLAGARPYYCDRASRPLVDARRINNIGPAKAGSVETDTIGVHFRKTLHVRHRITNIGDLRHWDQSATRFSTTLTEIAIIKIQRNVPLSLQPFRVIWQIHFFHAGKSLTEDHSPALIPRFVIVRYSDNANTRCAFTVEGDFAIHRVLPFLETATQDGRKGRPEEDSTPHSISFR